MSGFRPRFVTDATAIPDSPVRRFTNALTAPQAPIMYIMTTDSARAEEHVGEWKVRLAADSLEQLFAEMARVVARCCGPTRGEPGPWERVTLQANDADALLADWANELIGRSEVAQRAYDEVRNLTVAGTQLQADVRGREVVDWRSPLKAATYHGVHVARSDGGWSADVLFDV